MTVKANKWIVRMLLLLVLMGMFTVTVFAGSPGVGFSFHYTANHSVLTRNGEKTDAETSSGNYASVYIQSQSSGLQVTYIVKKNSNAVSLNHIAKGASNFKLYYTITPQNTTYTLHGLCAGTGTSAGVWYP